MNVNQITKYTEDSLNGGTLYFLHYLEQKH